MTCSIALFQSLHSSYLSNISKTVKGSSTFSNVTENANGQYYGTNKKSLFVPVTLLVLTMINGKYTSAV